MEHDFTKNQKIPDASHDISSALGSLLSVFGNYGAALTQYASDFMIPAWISGQYFQRIEIEKFLSSSPLSVFEAYCALLNYNLELMMRALSGGFDLSMKYNRQELERFFAAATANIGKPDAAWLADFCNRQAGLTRALALRYPEAIQNIELEFGFHFERGHHELTAETDRFYLYRISPSQPGVATDDTRKPVLIIPPYVLGANILAFLPGENKSYTHCFANQGVPTYIRILKDIKNCEALQRMRPEDEAEDTRRLCEIIFKQHQKPITLNGYCQGGFMALVDLLSGKLDNLVDAFITCMAPMDGTRSKGLSGFLDRLPQRFRDLSYGTKTLPNGNKVADGLLMGWVYKLKSIESEQPLAAFYRDLMRLASTDDPAAGISKTTAALNYWLRYERSDLPLEITRMSFASYTTPIADDGVLPVRVFDRQLNIKRIAERNIPWLICYGEKDDLVEKETALAPLDYVPVEITAFPKGHVAVATSWSDPASACALHKCFGPDKARGPVRFHLDLDAAMMKKRGAGSRHRR